MTDNSPKRFRETMTPSNVTRWMKYIKNRAMSFKSEKELEKDVKEFLETWDKVDNYKGPKKEGTCAWNQVYWTTLVQLDFQFVSLEEKYRKILMEKSK